MFYYSFTFTLPVKQHQMLFLLWNLVKQRKLALKNCIIYRIIVLSYHTIYPKNIAQFLIFYHTLSDGLLNWKFPWKSCSTTHPPFLLSNPKILKDFLKTFPTKMKPKCPAKEKKGGNKIEKRGEERKWKVKVQSAESLLYPKTISKFCFLCMSEIHKLIFCIWIRRLQGERPVNGFIVSFSSLLFYSMTVTRKLLD